MISFSENLSSWIPRPRIPILVQESDDCISSLFLLTLYYTVSAFRLVSLFDLDLEFYLELKLALIASYLVFGNLGSRIPRSRIPILFQEFHECDSSLFLLTLYYTVWAFKLVSVFNLELVFNLISQTRGISVYAGGTWLRCV